MTLQVNSEGEQVCDRHRALGKCWVESLSGTSVCKGPEVGGSFGCLRREKSRMDDVGERGRRCVRGKQECGHRALLQGKDFALSPTKNRMSLSDDSKSSEQNRLAIARRVWETHRFCRG